MPWDRHTMIHDIYHDISFVSDLFDLTVWWISWGLTLEMENYKIWKNTKVLSNWQLTLRDDAGYVQQLRREFEQQTNKCQN